MPPAARTPPRLLTLILLTALSTVALNLFLPSLPGIAAALRADYALVSLAVGGYLAVNALLMLIIGPLSDRYGRRPVMLAALALFTLASVGCAQADSVEAFLGFRVLQGAVIAGAALSAAIVRDQYSANDAASRLGAIGAAMAVAPMLGPVLGGALETLFGWRANFVAFALFGGALLTLCWFDLGETNTARSSTFDAQLRAYPRLFAARRFWGFALCTAFSTGAFYAFLAGAPLVAAARFGLEPAALGVGIGTITCGFMCGSALSSRYAGQLRLTTLILAGRASACGGMLLGIGLFAAGAASVWTLFGATVFVGLGNGLTMPSSNAGALSVRPELAGSASGLSGALTVGCGALLTSLTGALLSRHPSVYLLFAVMLASSLAALLAALDLRGGDRGAG